MKQQGLGAWNISGNGKELLLAPASFFFSFVFSVFLHWSELRIFGTPSSRVSSPKFQPFAFEELRSPKAYVTIRSIDYRCYFVLHIVNEVHTLPQVWLRRSAEELKKVLLHRLERYIEVVLVASLYVGTVCGIQEQLYLVFRQTSWVVVVETLSALQIGHEDEDSNRTRTGRHCSRASRTKPKYTDTEGLSLRSIAKYSPCAKSARAK